LSLEDDAIFSRFDFFENGRVERFQVHHFAFAAKQLKHALEIDRLGGVHVEGAHDVTLEVRRKILEHGGEILVRATCAERLHAINGFNPSFARQLHRRRFRRFVTRAADIERLRFPRPFRHRVLRQCG
jgi:hypothetical protein